MARKNRTQLKTQARKVFIVKTGGPAASVITRSSPVIGYLDDLLDSLQLAGEQVVQVLTSELQALQADDGIAPGQYYQLLDGHTPGLLVVFTAVDSAAGSGFASDGTSGRYVVETDILIAAGGGEDSPFKDDIIVSLSAGKSLGRYLDGQRIPAAGKTANEVLLALASEPVYPTYTPAAVRLSRSAPELGEVGETLTFTLTASFQQNDAGALVALAIKQDGQLLDQRASSPLSLTFSRTRPLGSLVFEALADYQAGAPRPVAPAGTPDERAAQIGRPDAPQAAQTGLSSGLVRFTGSIATWFGPAAAVPTTGQQVRALPSQLVGTAGATLLLNTGTTYTCFALWLPAGQALRLVTDLETNATLTDQYRPQVLAVPDAGGTLRNGTLYVMQQAVPYTSSHRHQLLAS